MDHPADRPAHRALAVLPTRLEPPYQRRGIIARAALVDRILACETPMVGVVAPAGYGKSTLVSQLGTAGTRLAWLSANHHDLDPATLVRDLAAAIDRVAPLTQTEVDVITGPAPSLWTAAIPCLGDVLLREGDVTLVVDDIDRIAAREAIDVIVALSEVIRGRRRIVVIGRSTGHLPSARLVARGALTILDRDDLAMDAVTIADVATAIGVALGATDAIDLAERTEGWAAGIYLSLLPTVSGRSTAAAMSSVAPERSVEAFLRSEVLDVLDDTDADLLLGASVLDRMSGQLCDSVLAREGSGLALDRLERSNLFLIPLDEARTWYRFHHLLGDFLRAELERRTPGRGNAIRQRACVWHMERGLPEQALDYAMAAGDETRAAVLMDGLIQPAHNMGRSATIRHWLDWVQDHPGVGLNTRLAAQATMFFATIGDGPMTERWATISASSLGSSELVPPDPLTAGIAAIARAMVMRDGLASATTDAEFAVDAIPDDHPYRVAALTALAVVRSMRGDQDGALTTVTDAITRWEALRTGHYAACYALILLASNALTRGDRTGGEQAITKARNVATTNHLAEHAVAVAIEALEARIAMAHGAIPRARTDLARAQRGRPELTYTFPWLALRARLDLIRAHLALGDGGGARTLMGEVDEILGVRPDMGVLLDERDELAERLRMMRGGQAGASTLTMAELRVLPMLTTHLTFREIGERLFVSSNTVKTQAISIYRKLDATSRNEAVERAIMLGLLEPVRTPEGFIRDG